MSGHTFRVIDTDAPLNEEDVDPDPFVEFDRWFRLAGAAGEPPPNAMALATITPDGLPAVRMGVLHRVDRSDLGFCRHHERGNVPAVAAQPVAAGAAHRA